MSPLNRGPIMGPRAPQPTTRQMSRYGRGPPPPPLPGMSRLMAPVVAPPIALFGSPRSRHIPPIPMMPRPNHMPPRGVSIFAPGLRGRPPVPPMHPMSLMPPMPMRGPMVPPHPLMRPGPRGMLPPHALPHMRPRLPIINKPKNNTSKKDNKFEDLEMKKPWMTDEIRSEIQKKNKLYAKAKKNKNAKEWEEFKDLRNKVTRMIRDAKNEYLAKHPEQAQCYEHEPDFAYDEMEDSNDEEEDNNEEEEACLYCETCDRDFASQEILERHVQEHQTCKIDGCTFTAHPKIVEKHIAMQHATGLYERMKHVMSDGDIEKWKAERKKRYPMATNIKLGKAEQLEKRKRGEVVGNHNEKHRRDTVKKEQTRKSFKKRRNRQWRNHIPEKSVVNKETYRGLLPFAGTAILDETQGSSDESLKEETVVDQKEEAVICKVSEISDIEISDEDQRNVTFDKKELKPEVGTSKVLSLVADYGSESDDEQPEEQPIIKYMVHEEYKDSQKVEPETGLVEKVTHAKKNVEVKNSSSISVGSKKRNTTDNERQFNRSQSHNSTKYSNSRLRLLNKLLARSIQHERNAIFQCITFIKNNNFLD
ncbi:nuclear fragile X mental retardation-interacting protein 1 [Copidosoma floridanum]|uniref:nuclear fragile X mental retardation-interacting protein 1 n=1 Tax=Copidosoma floridanum TaxID=29053 RepID=UPI0006C96388|nr:nuclear fragile X mental retardation-interacting protein 1 [Copidosoma floridanum]